MGLQENKKIYKSFDGIVPALRQQRVVIAQPAIRQTVSPKISPLVKNAEENFAVLSPELAEIEPVLETAAPVSDAKKRMFLRLAGLGGISAIAAMILPKKAQAYVFGGSPTSGVVGVKDASNNRINPAKEDGNLASINSQAQKLTFDGGSNLYVQAATNFSSQLENKTGSIINPAQEDGNLAAIATQTSKLTFDGSNNLLTATSGGASIVGLKDTTSTQVNPSTDDSLTYLRRMVKLLEPMGTVDIATRQRISLDTIPAGVTLPVVTTVSAVTAITNALPAGANIIGSIANVAGQNQQMYQDVARNAFASGIRQNLSWS